MKTNTQKQIIISIGLVLTLAVCAAEWVAAVPRRSEWRGVTSSAETVLFTNPVGQSEQIIFRAFQNIGTGAVMYAVGYTNLDLVTNCHGVVAGGLIYSDGLGSMCDLSKTVGPVYVKTLAGTSAVICVETRIKTK